MDEPWDHVPILDVEVVMRPIDIRRYDAGELAFMLIVIASVRGNAVEGRDRACVELQRIYDCLARTADEDLCNSRV